MSRTQAFLVAIALWAAIYLPGLGSTEIKGEEPRRIMPGVEMLESGDWLVPHLHGEPYLRKPPLVNWAIALSIKVFGARNEWTARLPSVLAVLALVLTTVGSVGAWRGYATGTIAAILLMTNLGLMEKGRLAEIEAIYISLFGIAIVCWLSKRAMKQSPWRTWLVPFFFLGLGLLAKGPLHVLFFYAVIIPILWRAGEMRELVRAPHIAGVILMLAVFGAWVIPYFRETAHLNTAEVWKSQMEERVGGGSFHAGSWLANIFLNGPANYVPWLPFLFLLWSDATLVKLSVNEASMVRAARAPVVICFFGLLLIPGMLPRYTLPMLVPASILLALTLHGRWPERVLRWAIGAGVFAGFAWCMYAILIVPKMNAAADSRPLGAKINEALPPGEPLYIYNPGLAPVMFYIRSRCVYAGEVRDLPDENALVFTREEGAKKLRRTWSNPRVLGDFTDKNKNRFFVLQLQGKL